jgi:hypothetical protein
MVERVSDVSDEETMRHVDQLSEDTQIALRELAAGEKRTVSGLVPGEVIVCETYVRVVPVEARIDEQETGTASVAGQ